MADTFDKATKRPWKPVHRKALGVVEIQDAEGKNVIATLVSDGADFSTGGNVVGDDDIANAALICAAVNNYKP